MEDDWYWYYLSHDGEISIFQSQNAVHHVAAK
jgi:hypothetical protein